MPALSRLDEVGRCHALRVDRRPAASKSTQPAITGYVVALACHLLGVRVREYQHWSSPVESPVSVAEEVMNEPHNGRCSISKWMRRRTTLWRELGVERDSGGVEEEARDEPQGVCCLSHGVA